MRPASLRDLSFGSSSDCSTYLIHLHGETPPTARSVQTDALQSAVSTAAPSPATVLATSPPPPPPPPRRRPRRHGGGGDGGGSNDKADLSAALRAARLSSFLSPDAPHEPVTLPHNDSDAHTHNAPAQETRTRPDDAADTTTAAAAAADDEDKAQATMTTTTAVLALAQHAAQHGKDAAARLLLRWLRRVAAATNNNSSNDSNDKEQASHIAVGDAHAPYATSRHSRSAGSHERSRSRHRRSHDTTAAAAVTRTTPTTTTTATATHAPLPLGFDGVFDDSESPSYRDHWVDGATDAYAAAATTTTTGVAQGGGAGQQQQQQQLSSSLLSRLSAASRAQLWSLLRQRGGLDVPLGVQRVFVSPPTPPHVLDANDAAALTPSAAADVLAALREGEEQQQLAAAVAAANNGGDDDGANDDAWDLSNVDVDLVSGLRNYCTHPNEWFAHLVAAALNTRSLHGHRVTASELGEAHNNPFLVRMILAAHCLDECDTAVQQHVQDTVDALLSMHSEGADQALYEYLCAFLPLPYVHLSEAQASQLERCGFEYIKLMNDNRHVLPHGAPYSIVVNYARKTLLLNVVAVVIDLLLTVLCCVVIALTIVRWMDHHRASNINFGFYTLLVLGCGYAVHIIAIIFILRSRQLERVYEVTTCGCHGDCHCHHHHHDDHRHHHHHHHHGRRGGGLVLPSPYLLSLPILPLFEAVALVTCVRARHCRWLILMHNCLVAARLAGLCFAVCFAVPQLITQSLLESIARGGGSDRAYNRWHYMFDFLTAATLVQATWALVRFAWMSAVYVSTDAFGFARFNLRRAQQLDRRFKRTFNVLHVVSFFLFETDVYLLIVCIMHLPSIDGGCRFLPVTLISLASIGGICIAALFVWLAVSPHLTLRVVALDMLIFVLHLTIFIFAVRRRYDHCRTFKNEVFFRYFVFGYFSCCTYMVVILVLFAFGLMFAVQSPMAATVCGMLMSCALRIMQRCKGGKKAKSSACDGDGDGDAATTAADTPPASDHDEHNNDDDDAAAAPPAAAATADDGNAAAAATAAPGTAATTTAPNEAAAAATPDAAATATAS